jgi:large subunit ribosomal protein L28
LNGTHVLLAAAPTASPCFRHWRRSSPLQPAGCSKSHFHTRGRNKKQHLSASGQFSKKPQYFLKKGLHFARQSATIVKLIILIPYFTAGGASTMAKCECCGKGVAFGIKVSHSHRRSNRTWKPNVRRVKAVVEGSPKYVYACSRCLRAGKVTRAV